MDENSLIERLYYSAPEEFSGDSWWSRYFRELRGLSETAAAALEADCDYIIRQGILPADLSNFHVWPANHVRTGLVLGAVQSGKTASMLGVSAMAIDHGIDMVIILGGTRLALWKQTYARVVQQLDTGQEGAEKVARRLLIPGKGMFNGDDSFDLQRIYSMGQARVRKLLKRRKPLIVVGMKQVDHLRALATNIQNDLFPVLNEIGRDMHMLVLDDEADDGSVLDAVVEASQDPLYGRLKQIPRAIANLWNPSGGAPVNLFTTYVGYTATPQANLLQEGQNPLAPRDFVVTLRTPSDTGYPVDLENPRNLSAPRSATYLEPGGIEKYYIGGEVFYRRGRSADLCISTDGNADELGEAIRAFLVAGAIRLHRSGKLGPRSAVDRMFESLEAAMHFSAEPNSMLLHPSAKIEEHFSSAEEVLMWAGGESKEEAREILNSGDARLPDSLITAMKADISPWSEWLDRYKQSAKAIESEFSLIRPLQFPSWDEIEKLLIEEVIPGTFIKIINSDPSADDRPNFTPEFDEAVQAWRAPRDQSTIFVSGNVMSRGITLEGLTTVLFQRSAAVPFADTQMQMQRWFGYRGSYVELCRLFASGEQLALFASYHDTDEALRTEVSALMAGDAPEPSVLQGANFLATGKIANLNTYPLAPGPQPFIRITNDGQNEDPNIRLIAELFQAPSCDLTCTGKRRGRILTNPLSLAEVANLLDRLRYSSYAPGNDTEVAKLWRQIESRLAAISEVDPSGLYRPPGENTAGDTPRRFCPYGIAAYLRLWDACLTRPVRGMFTTGEIDSPWSMLDLEIKRKEQPRFWVGIRYGNGKVVDSGPVSDLPFEVHATMKNVEGSELTTTWGASDPRAEKWQYRGDEYFDYYHTGEELPSTASEASWRPPGSDGLVLFYINQLERQSYPAAALGLCIPAGGPEQFSAVRVSKMRKGAL